MCRIGQINFSTLYRPKLRFPYVMLTNTGPFLHKFGREYIGQNFCKKRKRGKFCPILHISYIMKLIFSSSAVCRCMHTSAAVYN